MSPSSPATQQTLTARSPEDVLAAVPLVLGFVPDESIVMLTFDADHTFHARLDLPHTSRQRRAAAESLVAPAGRHGVRRALFVLYTSSSTAARSCARALVHTFTGHGIDVIDVLRADGTRWFPVSLDRSVRVGPGTPYDVSGHLFTAQAVADGRVTLASRAELAATVAPDPSGVRDVALAVADLGPGPPCSEQQAREDVMLLVSAGCTPDPATAARLLVALRQPGVRDAVLAGLDRPEAERQLPVWSALVRVAPPHLVSPVASVLAFLAWQSGDGALAWCALDRAAEDERPCRLAGLVAQALEHAVPPAFWVAG
jgi:hypothetical protein